MVYQIALINSKNKVVDTLMVSSLNESEIQNFLNLEIYNDKDITYWKEVPKFFPISLDFEYVDGEFRLEYPTMPGEWIWNAEYLQWRKPFPSQEPDSGYTWFWDALELEWIQKIVNVGR